MNYSLEFQILLDNAIKEKLYKSLVKQINKDFSRAAVDENFSVDIQPQSLARSLVASLYELITRDFEIYLSFLYAVDVPESSIKALPEQHVDEMAQSVALLVLKREWQKVWYKAQN
ncbi:MAG: hypothetical protein V7767_01715 [Leeuwenhoekiella sp.]